MVPLNPPTLVRILRINQFLSLLICLFGYLVLLVLNYAIVQEIARRRGTSAASLEIGLLFSWIAGPFITADFFRIEFIQLLKGDFGSMNRHFSELIIIGFAWHTVRKAEREGWEKVDPKGPKSLSDALKK